MDLRQLEYFAAVARHRHFTRAAEELYVTQPALSQQVRRLERELGLELLTRTSRRRADPAGQELLARAESILAEVGRARALNAGLGASVVPASWLDAPGPEVSVARLDPEPRLRPFLLGPAVGLSPAGRLLHAQLLEALS